MFPTEIWEQIIRNTEAATLVNLRTVNSTWNAIITKHLQESDAWYEQCKRSVPEEYWLILLENSFHLINLQRQNNNDYQTERYNYKIWLTIYKAWLKWCKVEYFNVHTITEIEPIPKHCLSERITSCAVLGELVAVGSSEGYIRIFNLRTHKLVFRVDQYEQVQDIKLCVQGKQNEKIIVIATSNSGINRIWDITSQKKLVFSSGDVICAGYGYYCTAKYYDEILVYDATSEDQFPTRLSMHDLISITNVTNHIYGMPNNVKHVNMIVYKYQLCFWSANGLYFELDLREVEQPLHFWCTVVGVPKNEKICQYYLFNPYTAFCITEKGYLGISVDKNKWQMYNIFSFLQSIVTSIFFYVRVLILGLDSGDVILYFVENELALRTINFKSKKSKRIQIASEPIVSLNLMEISGDQTLLVTTRKTIYHVNLQTYII